MGRGLKREVRSKVKQPGQEKRAGRKRRGGENGKSGRLVF